MRARAAAVGQPSANMRSVMCAAPASERSRSARHTTLARRHEIPLRTTTAAGRSTPAITDKSLPNYYYIVRVG